MTTVLHLPRTRTTAPVQRPLTSEEVAEVTRLTADLPQLVTGWSTAMPVGLDDAAMRIEAAVWQVATRHGIDLCPECSTLDVADALALKGWSAGAARDALRALVMLRSLRPAATTAHEILAARAAGRLVSYLELRSRFG
jgi:hypothetical protein